MVYKYGDYGAYRVAVASPNTIKIGNPEFNASEIIRIIKQTRPSMYKNLADVIVFPELSLTGYTCGDLFFQSNLLDSAMVSLKKIAENVDKEIVFVGVPVRFENQLYNCAAVLHSREVFAFIPKTHIPNYNEFYEKRYFSSATKLKRGTINFFGKNVMFGTDILIHQSSLVIGCEICEDAWVPIPPNARHCLNGANLIVNLSASNEIASKRAYRENLIKMHSATDICAYAYTSASRDESTSDTVFSGHKLICENGSILAESCFLDDEEIIYAEIDVERLMADRARSTSYMETNTDDDYRNIYFSESCSPKFNRKVSLTPFVPKNIDERAKEILDIQAAGLAQRLKKINCKKVVVGVSGGLDSTLALLAACNAFDINDYDKSGIIGITMPGFGTTSRTYKNALRLMKSLGITQMEIDIKKACEQHFKDIEHPDDLYDVTYENVQARERTQILMDVANKEGAIVIGTGDLSELALGWCTYNGDHMSMYAVNNSIPKTLVRHLVKYYANNHANETIKNCLGDILDTPISPELLPPNEDGTIAQKTEESIGNYTIHDFVLYYALRFGFSPTKIYKLFLNSAKDDDEWKNLSELYLAENMKIFYKRFFAQQFKRNCVPDGIKVGSISLSPRADWRMPSDACNELWMEEVDELIESASPMKLTKSN